VTVEASSEEPSSSSSGSVDLPSRGDGDCDGGIGGGGGGTVVRGWEGVEDLVGVSGMSIGGLSKMGFESNDEIGEGSVGSCAGG
jgi:hypothetical protein